MILQRDPKLYGPIRKEGCYLMSILFLCNKHTGRSFEIAHINRIFDAMLNAGYIDATCFVKDPEAAFRWLGLRVHYTDRHEKPDRDCGPDEIEILEFRSPTGWRHFVVGDGQGHVAYDPWGNSAAVRHGELVSKRIFQLL